MTSGWEAQKPEDAPGPLGCRYDDGLTKLDIQLVVPGIRGKSMFRAPNTDVHLKYDQYSMSLSIEIVKFDKNKTPPERTIVDRRWFEIKRFPSEISEIHHKLKKDCVVVTVMKKAPKSWQHEISQFGTT